MIINPATTNTTLTDKSAENFYSINLCTTSINGSKKNELLNGYANSDVLGVRIYTMHTKLMDITTSIIKKTVNSNYIPPIYSSGVADVGLRYDINGDLTTTDYLADEATFGTFVKNATVNTFNPNLSVANLESSKVDFIVKRIYPLFIRILNHLTSAETVTEFVCNSSSNPRLFHMLIENCLFNLEFYYN